MNIGSHNQHNNILNKDQYHPLLEINIDVTPKYLTENTQIKLNFRKANYELINSALNLVNWRFLDNLSVDESVSALYHEINQIIQKYIPLKLKRSKFPFWFSHELKIEINRKERAHRAWKKTGLTIEQCHEIYIDQLQINLSKNIKLFWAYTKSKKQTNTYPNEIISQHKKATDPGSISDMFSTYFQITYTNHSTVFPLSNTAHNVSPTNNHQEITRQEVEEILSRLDENKNGGPDQLSNYFIIKIREHLAYLLSIIFNKSLIYGIFPNQFKYGYITPIYKKGD